MDPIKTELQMLVEDDIDTLSGEEQRRRICDALNYETYAAETRPLSTTPSMYNPGVEGYLETHDLTEDGWKPIEDTTPCAKYPEYLPSDAAIKTLVEYSPILEIGAGSGYWSHVVNKKGGDCLATDIRPEPVEAASFPTTKTYPTPDDEGDYTIKLWEDVVEADHTCIPEYPNRTVLLCHPPVEPWTEQVLDLLGSNQYFVFVGEWYPGADATPMFFKRLIDEFQVVERFPVYNWASTHAGGYVFTADRD